MAGAEDSSGKSRQREYAPALVEAIFEASPSGALVVDENERIIAHNQRLFEVFDIDSAALFGEGGHDLAGRDDNPLLSAVLERVQYPDPFLDRVRELYAHPELDDHCEIDLKDGRTLERHSTGLWDDEHEYIGRVWFFRDITDRKQLERRLKESSYRDPLTGVANRREFFERADEEIARARRHGRDLAFVMFDVDRFKQINDSWGHSVGDQVLLDLCASVDPILREEDVFARVGGEEFALLLPDTDLDGAYTLAERLREKLAADGSGEVSYTVSAGVAKLMPDDAHARRPLQRADAALYEAKRDGRDRTYVSE